jgi:hypothetical protein
VCLYDERLRVCVPARQFSWCVISHGTCAMLFIVACAGYHAGENHGSSTQTRNNQKCKRTNGAASMDTSVQQRKVWFVEKSLRNHDNACESLSLLPPSLFHKRTSGDKCHIFLRQTFGRHTACTQPLRDPIEGSRRLDANLDSLAQAVVVDQQTDQNPAPN